MAERQTKRLRRLRRANQTEAPNLEVTPRDIEIIKAVYYYRALTTRQITALIFNKDGRSSQAEERLKRLFHHGYLERRSQGIVYQDNKPLVYLLATKGARLLAEVEELAEEEIIWKPKYNQISNHHLAHVIAVSEVRIAIVRSCKKMNYELTWLDEMTIRHHALYDTFDYHTPTGWTKKTALIPDSFFAIETPTTYVPCFLEVDRGTETLGTIANKFAKYVTYFQTEEYLARYSAHNKEGHEIPPTVLTVTTSEQRLRNLMAVASDIGADDNYLFSTFEEVTHAQVLSHEVWRMWSAEAAIQLIR